MLEGDTVMKSKKVFIRVQSSSMFHQQSVVMINEKMIKKWKIPTHRPIILHFGSFREEVQVSPVSGGSGVRFNEALARRLGIPHGAELRMKYKPGAGSLHIGPVIGVMVSRVLPSQPSNLFGSITAFCQEMSDACKQLGAFVYFFSPKALQPGSRTIEGWSRSGRWYKAAFPVPDVIQNRLTTRKLENKPSVQQFLKEAKMRYNTFIFNETFLNKNEVFDALKHDASLSHYLPESHLIRQVHILKSMCARYSSVFLKPVRGSLGKGIIKITRNPGGGYVCYLSSVNGSKRQEFANFTKMSSALASKFKANRYQIQQGISLIKVSGRSVDFRALVQKNEKGKWQITSIVARIAGNQHIVSNLARGGSLTTAKEAILKSNLPTAYRKASVTKLRGAALRIARGIEEQIPSHFGELGVDLGLDRSGKVWLIEVNSKPSKNDNTQLQESKIRPSVKQIVKYSRYLAGF